jgi:hypothetical protein
MVFYIPKYADSILTQVRAKHFEPSTESIGKVVRNRNGAARFRGADRFQRKGANIIGLKMGSRDARAVNGRREARIEIRILQEVFQVNDCIGEGKRVQPPC